MFTLRCTARLLKRMDCHGPDTASTTRLGDWYADLIHVGRQQLVIAVSDKTFLPVVVPAAPKATLVDRIREAVAAVLQVHGIPVPEIHAEYVAMEEYGCSKTANRQVVGVLVEFAWLFSHSFDGDWSLLELALRLGETPCSPLYKTKGPGSPDRATIALFASPRLRIVR